MIVIMKPGGYMRPSSFIVPFAFMISGLMLAGPGVETTILAEIMKPIRTVERNGAMDTLNLHDHEHDHRGGP
jgi:hypothetical protein